MEYADINRSVLGFWTEKDKRLEAAHILDLCEAAFYYGELAVTPFLSMGMLMWTEDILRSIKLNYLSNGGLPEAERVRLVIASHEEVIDPDQSLIDLVKITPAKDVVLPHRHVLGSLLGLGIERSVIGDIRQGKTGVYAAIAQEITPFILENIKTIGREKVSIEIAREPIELFPISGETKRITVPSSRLDAVASSVFGISRSSMKEWIETGIVKKNDIVITKPDAEIQERDIISCRGKGRFKVLESTGKTRKGREAWEVFIYKEI